MEKYQRINGIKMKCEEFQKLVENATKGAATVLYDANGWGFLVETSMEVETEIEKQDILEALGKELNEKVTEVVVNYEEDGNDTVIIVLK